MNSIDTPLSLPARTSPRSPRRGFTLIELLVVVAVMGVLATIMVFVYSPFQTRSAANYGGVLLQSWLNAAKQRALRDQRYVGLRLLVGDQYGANMVNKCIYVEQPEPIVDEISGSGKNFNLKSATFDASGTVCVEFNGGLVHEGAVTQGSGAITLTNALPYTIAANSGVKARVFYAASGAATDSNIASEDLLRLPVGAAINLDANATMGSAAYPLSPASAPLDIIFAPDGSVLLPALNNDKIILWVTNTIESPPGTYNPQQNQPTLIVVYTRTGAIAAYPAEIDTPANAYKQVP